MSLREAAHEAVFFVAHAVVATVGLILTLDAAEDARWHYRRSKWRWSE